MESYLVFDFETSGLSPTVDRIIQVGLCKVENSCVVERDGWLVNQDVRIAADATRVHGLTAEDTRARGISPADSLTHLLARMREAPACMGHNIHLFDILLLHAECKRQGVPLPDAREFVDTAALYKGWKLSMRKQPRETEQAYAHRVLSRRVKGLKYSIPTCIRELRITTDESSLHGASFDAYTTHLIYEALKPRL